jgi:hypothetical protein
VSVNFNDADTPTELLEMFAGAASMCWENPSGAGVFDCALASEAIDAALARLIELGWAT